MQHPTPGEPATSYINASEITFPAFKQVFLATQGPKPNSFENFWQLIAEKKARLRVQFYLILLSYWWSMQVGVLVMITGLEEGGKLKAHQYWPEEGEPLQLANNITVELLSSSYQGTFYERWVIDVQDYFMYYILHYLYPVTLYVIPTRKLRLTLASREQEVTQLQTEEWRDLTAPSETRVLRDLVTRTRELNTDAGGRREKAKPKQLIWQTRCWFTAAPGWGGRGPSSPCTSW